MSEQEAFDPTAYPEDFTTEVFRKLPMRDVLLVERHLDEMTEAQQASFKAARADFMAPIFEKVRSSFARVPPTQSVLSPDVQRSFDRLTERIRIRSSALDDVEVAAGEAGAGALDALATTSASAEVTPSELEREVDQDTDLLVVMTNMLDLMERQHLTSTRSAFFAVLVSLMVIVAGVAPIVGAETWSERLRVIFLSLGLGAVALLAYWVVRLWQERDRKPQPPLGR